MTDGEIVEKAAFEFPQAMRDAAGQFSGGFEYLDTVEASAITYMSDGLRIKGFYVKPRGTGPFPCIICNRGGNREFGSINPQVVVNLLCRIASWGYLVVASQYRGGCGSEGRDEFGGGDLSDVLNLFPLIDNDECADPARIGMYGGSRGGMMTYLALTKTTRVGAAVIRCGVSDLTNWSDDRKDMEEVYNDLIPGFQADREAALERRSAAYWPEKLCRTTPILMLQGTADWRVNPLSALRMGERLLKEGHPFRLVMLEGADHALSECIPERNRQTRDWFDRFVLRREALPDMRPHGD
ncbi:MAG: prolyl oligopeptidase family serine peptidase [Rectinemataceae bacterium]|nr:prolyl oligopeptidase family serine peptidase [Rectinemataceae bacterium]